MVRFNLLNCIGLFAILAMACLAAPPGAVASDGLFIDNQNTETTLVSTDPYEGDIRPIDSDVLALVPIDPASGMKMDFAAVVSAEQWTASESYTVLKGGAASAYSKPRHIHIY